MADCFNHGCPFRVNETSNANRCECLACPNRCSGDGFFSYNRTLTDEELEKFRMEYNEKGGDSEGYFSLVWISF